MTPHSGLGVFPKSLGINEVAKSQPDPAPYLSAEIASSLMISLFYVDRVASSNYALFTIERVFYRLRTG